MGWQDAPIVGSKPNDSAFQAWYGFHAKRQGLNPDPDAPEHFYDYRAAFRAGAKPDKSGHWPSQFKREGHPNLVIEGVDTRTGEPVRPVKAAWESAPLVEEVQEAAPQDDRATFTLGGLTPALTHRGKVTTREAIGAPLLGMGVGAGLAAGAAGVAAAPAAAPAVAAAAKAAWPLLKDAGTYYAGDKILETVGIPSETRAAILIAVGLKRSGPMRGRPTGKPPATPKAAASKATTPPASAPPAPAAPVTPPAAPKVDRGKQVAAEHARRVAFAKEIAAKNPRVGERVWMELNESGVPIRHLTADQAGAVTRRGGRATWIRNLWK